MSLASPPQPLPVDNLRSDNFGRVFGQVWRNVLPLFVIFTIGFMFSLGAYLAANDWDNVRQKEHFERLAQEQIREIQTKILSTASVLRSIRGLFNAAGTVSRQEFKIFVKSLEAETQVQALEWIPRVPHAERPEFERAALADGLSGFQFTERSDQGVMTRATERAVHFPVYFVEPLEGNERALGFDLGSSSTRRAALNEARSSGQEIASARITLVQETGEQYGFLIFIPVYKGGDVPDSVQQRETDLVGFGLGVFRMGDLVASALSGGQGHASEIDIFVYDSSAPTDSQLLFPKGSSFENSDSLPIALRYEAEMEFAGRNWNIAAIPAQNSAFFVMSWTPWLVFALGLFATTLTALYFNVVLSRTRYADELVGIRTAELVQANDARELIMKELTQTNSDLESFTYVASHDLKAPLRGIDNLVTWITEDPDSTLSEESRRNAARLRIRITRLEGLLDGLLEYSRVGRLKAETTTVDSRELCEEIVEYLAPPDGFTVEIGTELPEFETVKSALQTVLSNLINNAIKHHDAKQGSISVTAVDLGDVYKFSVSDDGPGIDPAYHSRVFEIFQTLAPRSKMDTSGIGLSIVTRLVAAAGGSVTIKSECGKRGTVFEFTWKKSWPKEAE